MSDTLRVSNLHFGNAASNNNQPQMGFTSVGIGSTANYGFLQFFGTSNTLCWTANGTVGIGTTNPGYTIDVNGSSSALGLSILRSTTTSGSGRISYYNNTGSVAYWLLGSISSLVGNYGGSIDINGDLVRVDTALKNIQFGCSVNYSNFTVNRSSASGTTGTINGNIVVYRNTTTSLYDVYLVFGSYSSFVGDVIYSGTSSINLTPNLVAAPSASGTYILAWDSSVNTYMAITNSGQVGIGVTNPGATLQINDNSVTSASFPLSIFSPNLAVGGEQYILFGTASSTANQVQIGFRNVGAGSSFNYSFIQNYGVANAMCWRANGMVGIGITNPTTTLHVVGSTSVGTPAVVSFVNNGGGQNGTGSDIVNSQITMGLYGPYIRSVQRNSAYTDGMRLDLCTNIGSNDGAPVPRISILSGLFGGNVGIGVTAPVGSLHINGITGSGLWGNACLVITNSISGAAGTTSGTSIQLHNAFNSTYFNMMSYGYTGGSAFYITSDSLVGVTFSRGQNAWSAYSDSRMKINKTPLSSELSNILKLNPVSYLYDTDPSENVAIVTRVGFLADEVAEIYPNLVTKDSGMPYTNQEGETFIPMTMCMTNLIPYHTKAIQELAYKNDTLEAKNAELTQKLDSLLAWAQAQGFSS